MKLWLKVWVMKTQDRKLPLTDQGVLQMAVAQGGPCVSGLLVVSPEEDTLCVVSESENKSPKSSPWDYSVLFVLFGKSRPLTHTYQQEEAPPWRQGAASVVPLADMRWC